MSNQTNTTFSRVGVIGAGTMGVGMATDLLLHGIDVVLVDLYPERLAAARTELLQSVRLAPLLLKNAPAIPSAEIDRRTVFSTAIEDVRDCEFIVENVTEAWAPKEQVYKALNKICPPEVCFGMNTSCTSITMAGSLLSDASRLIGVHFMNPVFLKPTVEVIRGFHTSDRTLSQLNSLLQQLGKEGIVVNDYPGFVSNRISHLFMNEAMYVVQDQVAEPSQVDAIFKKCFGHTLGPLETADLIGLDTVMHSLDVLFDSYQDSKFRCCPLLKKMVYAGQLGRKSGKGFYQYTNA